jgi:hypothetical protein
MDIIRYGPNRIQIYLSTVKDGFGRLGTLTAPVGSLNPTRCTWKSGSDVLPAVTPVRIRKLPNIEPFGAIKAA